MIWCFLVSNDIKLSDILSKSDLALLRKKSSLKACFMVLMNFSIMALAFSTVIVWTNPLTILLCMLLLGGRQLGIGILVHECAHKAFFDSDRLNDFVGQWVCGPLINLSVHDYRKYHLRHHRHAGTDDDPDQIFVAKYPVTKASLRRKIIRDITGQTAYRDTLRKLLMFRWPSNAPWLVSHLLLLLTLTAFGFPMAYLLWWASEFFVYPLLVRLRQIGEHGVALNRYERAPRLNTGTTLVSWWERLLMAPNYVNYHVEHHQFATVPCYNLPALHRLLKKGGYFDGYNCIANGYVDVLRRAVQNIEPTPSN